MTNPEPTLNYRTPEGARANGLGVAGFVVSLVGLVGCMLLCPVGLVLSAFGMRQQPRGLAIAGLTIGIIGTLTLGALVIFVSYGVYTAYTFSKVTIPRAQTSFSLGTASTRVQTYYDTHGETLPADNDGNALIGAELDGWGRPMRYLLTGPGAYEIRSAGPDGVFDNLDDQHEEFNPTAFSPTSATSPGTEPTPEK